MIIYNIEGAVGSGKTTFLDTVEDYTNTHGYAGVLVVREPVDEWTHGGQVEGGEEISPLRAFYEEPEENAGLFQVYAFVSRMCKVDREIRGYEAAYGELPKAVFVERFGGYADENVFVRVLCERGIIKMHQYEMYRRILDLWRSRFSFPEHEMVILYLTAPFNVTRTRIADRDREAERVADTGHILRIYNAYEAWLGRDDTIVDTLLDRIVRVYALDNTLAAHRMIHHVEEIFQSETFLDHFIM